VRSPASLQEQLLSQVRRAAREVSELLRDAERS
jgi:hypothetical protein